MFPCSGWRIHRNDTSISTEFRNAIRLKLVSGNADIGLPGYAYPLLQAAQDPTPRPNTQDPASSSEQTQRAEEAAQRVANYREDKAMRFPYDPVQIKKQIKKPERLETEFAGRESNCAGRDTGCKHPDDPDFFP